METTTTSKVYKKEDKYFIEHNIIEEYDFSEFRKIPEAIRQNYMKISEEIVKLEKNLEDDMFEKQLKKDVEQREKLSKLETDAREVVKTALDKWKDDIKLTINTAKKAIGYDKLKDDKKHNERNKILANACEKFDLDRNGQVIREMAIEFDKI